MGPLLGAALSFGSSFLSGLFGKSGAKKRAEEEKRAIDEANRINQARADTMNKTIRARADRAAKIPIVTMQTGNTNMSMMVADSVRNGFNPLTVLRSGGLGLYANTKTTVTGSTMMDAALSGQHIATFQPLISQTQVPSTGEVLGKALESGVGTYQNMMSTQQAQQFQMDLVGMQLAGANANSAANHLFNRSFYTPSAQFSGSVSRNGGGELGDTGRSDVSDWLKPWVNPSLLGNAEQQAVTGPEADYLPFLGMKWFRDPGTARAHLWEDWYGDDISPVTAPTIGTADLLHNTRFNPAFQRLIGGALVPGFAAVKNAVDIYLLTGGWPKGSPAGPPLKNPGKNLSPASAGMGAFQ